MTETVARETQADAVLLIMRGMRDMGYVEATVKVSRGGTVEATGKVEGGKVVKPAFTTGLKR